MSEITNGGFATPHERGAAVGTRIFDTLGKAQANAPRSKQSSRRTLGMSEMGHCREYIRATIAGDPKHEVTRIKLPAYVGTAFGDKAEADLKSELGDTVVTQKKMTVSIPIPNDIEGAEPRTINVSGSLDAAFFNWFGDDIDDLIDFKTKDGVGVVRSEGPSFKECAQISGYLIAGIDDGTLRPGSMAHLVYVDRAGNDKHPWVYTITEDDARKLLTLVGVRLHEVASAITAKVSQSYLRDMPESWCHSVGCPFYDACWEGYQPTGEITNVAAIAAMELYDKGRDLAKLGEQYKRQAKAFLNPDAEDIEHRTEGVGPTFTLKWTDRAYEWGISASIDLRRNK